MALPASPPTNRELNKRRWGGLIDTVAIDTLGCKLNQAESESLGRSLTDIGFTVVTPTESPSVYILNTCTVTHIADRKSRHLLRLARRRNPNAIIIATGCYAERAPQDLAQMPEVELKVDNNDKIRLPDILQDYTHGDTQEARYPRIRRTRSFIKVQEGCDQFCSYCIVPLVRGRECSLTTDDVLAEVKRRVEDGHKEIVITGTRIGSYREGLENLTRLILAETTVPRLRLSSLQPQEITTSLLSLWRDNRLCRHFHIPLQSGSDSVLQRMGRRYDTAEYGRVVCQMREMIPDVAITTDLMVGFPGETEEEFNESYRFCRQLNFAGIHVFQYSPRPDTRAMHMGGTIADNVKKERSDKMLRLAKETAYSFRSRFLNRNMDVLWERQVSKGVWSGLTSKYIRAFAQSDEQLADKCLQVVVSGCNDKHVLADLVCR
jgi:threonylcarbamoyladenosine tRNA methylthiotransferase MtaB